MNRSKQYFTSVVVLLTYLVSGLLIEVTHHDVSDFFLRSTETVSSHDCGANEIHLSMDKRHECVACSHLTLRVATTASRFFNDENTLESQFFSASYSERTLQPDGFTSGSRAPPLPSV